MLAVRTFPPGSVLFRSGEQTPGVWIVRDGRIELSVGSGRRRAVVQLLRSGDVDGDIQLLLEMPLPYAGRALTEVTCLFLGQEDFEELLAPRPGIARRWLSSVAQRLAASQARVLALLGGSLAAQAARLLGRGGGGRAGGTAAADPGRDAGGAAALAEQGAQGPGTRRPDPHQLRRYRGSRPAQARRPRLTRQA